MALDTIVTGSKLTTLANAIRTKGGTSAQLTLDQMAQAVANIPSGGVSFDWSQCKGDAGQYGSSPLQFRNPTATQLDFTGLDISSFNSLGSMFAACSALTSLDLSGFSTSHIKTMSSMFSACSALTSLNISSLNTSNVIAMGSMFAGCSSLATIDISHFDTRNVSDFGSMFNACYALTSLNVPNLGTKAGASFYMTFQNCNHLESVNLSGIKTNSNSFLNNMFAGCSALTDIIWSQESSVQPLPSTPSSMKVSATMKFYVPDDLVNDYKAATNWSTIASQIYSINDLPAALKTLYGIS